MRPAFWLSRSSGLRILLAAYWLLLCIATHLPARAMQPYRSLLAHGMDKLVHAAAYAFLGAILTLVSSQFRQLRLQAITIVVVLAGYGAADEWLQGFVAGRSPDALDWVFDTLGAAAGVYIAGLWLRRAVADASLSRDLVKRT